MLAVERALERYPDLRGRFSFVQLAAPSPSAIACYQQLTNNITEITSRINARSARSAYRPIILLRAHHEPWPKRPPPSARWTSTIWASSRSGSNDPRASHGNA